MSDETNEQQAELFPEYAPDYTDSTVWIEVRTPELIRLGRIPGMEGEEGREVLSGRMLVSHRKRTPEDGSAEFVIEKAPTRKASDDSEPPICWPKCGEPGPKVDPRIRHNSGPRAFRSLAETGGPNGHYNENVQRWWQKPEDLE